MQQNLCRARKEEKYGETKKDLCGNVTGYTAGKITTSTKDYLIEVPNDSKLIVESGIIELNKSDLTDIQAPIMLMNSTTNGTINGASNASVGINGGVVTSTGYGIAVYGAGEGATPSSITVNKGIVKSYYPALLGNGTYHNTEMNVNGGELYSESVTIYQPQQGELNIKPQLKITLFQTEGIEAAQASAPLLLQISAEL